MDNFEIKLTTVKDIHENWVIVDDLCLAVSSPYRFTGISYTQYKKIMKNKYNGIDGDFYIYFEKKEDAEKALEYLNSIIIMNKIRG